MNYRTFTLPKGIELSIPSDYARTRPGGPIAVTQQGYGDGLRVEWDDSRITFSSANGSVTYRRPAIVRYLVEERRFMTWRLREFSADLRDGSQPILYCQSADGPQLDDLVRSLTIAGVPISAGLGGSGAAHLSP